MNKTICDHDKNKHSNMHGKPTTRKHGECRFYFTYIVMRHEFVAARVCICQYRDIYVNKHALEIRFQIEVQGGF